MRPAPKRFKYRRPEFRQLRTQHSRSKNPGGVCHYCGKRVSVLTRDHIVPKARRGADTPWNIVWACNGCNNVKADSWPTCECDFCTTAIARQTRARRPDTP